MRHIYFCCLFVFLFFAQAFQAFGNKLPALHPENSNSTDLYLNNNAYTYHWHNPEAKVNTAEMEMQKSSTTRTVTVTTGPVCTGTQIRIDYYADVDANARIRYYDGTSWILGNLGVKSITIYRTPGVGTWYYYTDVQWSSGHIEYNYATGSIQVLGNTATAGAISPSASSVCGGTQITLNSTTNAIAAGGTTLNIRWYRHHASTDWVPLVHNNSQTLTTTLPTASGTYTFLRRAWSSCGGECSPACYDATTTVTVLATPTSPAIAGGGVTICNGSSVQLTGSATAPPPGEGIRVRFRAQYYGDDSAWRLERVSDGVTLVSGGPYNNTSWTETTHQYDYPVRLRLYSTGSYCDNNPQWEVLCNGALIGSGTASNYCDAPIVLNNINCSQNNLSYSWSPTTGLNNPNIHNPLATPTSTTAYTMTAAIGGCSATANTTITVQNPPAITAHPSTSAVERCRNSTAFNALSVTATGTATLTYQWYWNSTASNTGGTLISGATSSTYTPPNSTDGTRYYYCIVSNTCGGAARTATSNVSGAHTVHTPPNLGTVSNAGPINFCASNGNYGTAVSVSGSAGTIEWDWGSNNGTWNYWQTGTSSGVCCFPKKTSNSDGNADRIRYRAVSGTCAPLTSSTILITNRWNEDPTSLTSTTNAYCGNTAPANITLTASFPAHINMNGTVKFYSGSCGGTLIETVNPSATSSTAVLTITAPTATTTYYARYEPGTGTGCNNSPCVSTSVTVHPFPAPVTVSGGGTYCGSAVLTASGGAGGTVYYQGTTNNGTSTADATTTKTISTLGTNTYYFRSGTAQGCWGVQGSQSLTINPVPTAPTASAATNIESNAFSANWSAVAGASHYLLDVSTQSNFSTFVPGYEATNVGNVLFFNVTNVTALTTYYYRVRAVHTTGGCVGANSATITVNTGACTAPVMQTITYPPGN